MVYWKLSSPSVWKSKLLVLIPQLFRALTWEGKERAWRTIWDNRWSMHVQPVRNTFMLNWIICLGLTKIKMHKLWCQHLQYSTMTSGLMTEKHLELLHGNNELKVGSERSLFNLDVKLKKSQGNGDAWKGECLMIFMESHTWTCTRRWCWSNPTEMRCKTFFILFLLVLPISSANCERAFSAQKRRKSDVRSSLTSSSLSDLILISTEELQQYDPSSAVERWLKSSGKRKPFAKK